MNRIAAQTAELAKSWPSFLDDLDRRPDRARNAFMESGYRLLMAAPPRAFGWFDPDERSGLAAAALEKLVANDFRKLRRYRDDGNRFAGWLAAAANNHARDVFKAEKRRREREIGVDEPDPGVLAPEVHTKPVDSLTVRKVREVIDGMGYRCRKVLLGRLVWEFSNKELAALESAHGVTNKQIGDWFKDCRKKLAARLGELGLLPGDAGGRPLAGEGGS